jgi:outer membrane receptor protein involved in Fe transport
VHLVNTAIRDGYLFHRIAVLVAIGWFSAAPAVGAELLSFDIPPQPAPQALTEYAEQARTTLLFAQHDIDGERILKGVSGNLSKREALSRLLEGSDLAYRYRDEDTVTIFRSAPEQNVGGGGESGASVGPISDAPESTAVPSVDSAKTPQPASVPDDARVSPQSSSMAIEEIVVTAQKRSGLARETPISMTSVGQDLANQYGIVNVVDLNQLVPNLSIGQANSATKLTIRGIGNENIVLGGDPGVAFHTDGVYIVRTEAITAAFFDFDRVEVLRGPQGTLYGRNATGGAINVINKLPTNEFEGEAYFEGGNLDHFGGGGVLSGPLVEDALLGRLSFRVSDREGYVRNVVSGKPDLNSQEFASVRGQLMFTPTETLTVRLSADYHRTMTPALHRGRSER